MIYLGARKKILCAALALVMFCAVVPYAGAAAAEQSAQSAPAGKPRVIVEGCSVEGGGIVSGAVCEVTISLHNTSQSAAVSSVLVTGRWPGDTPSPVEFTVTNQAYLSRIAPAQTRNVVFTVKAKSVSTIAFDTIPLQVDITYSYDQFPDNSNSVTLQIPVGGDQEARPDQPEIGALAASERFSWISLPIDRQLFFAGCSAFFAVCACIYILLRRKHRRL
jgi:hypothetical protein